MVTLDKLEKIGPGAWHMLNFMNSNAKSSAIILGILQDIKPFTELLDWFAKNRTLLKMEALNIERIGPGAWYIIHLMSANAKTMVQIEAVHVVLKMISEKFFCIKCRTHFAENMKKFPPPKVNSYSELFIWSVEMHNRVNITNDKPVVSYREALDHYVGRNAECSGDCGAKKPIPIPTSESLLSVLAGGENIKFPYRTSSRREL
jgi:hypothetical protein